MINFDDAINKETNKQAKNIIQTALKLMIMHRE